MNFSRDSRPRFTVQDCTYLQGLTAIQMASQFESWNDLRPELEEVIPFNSAQTRRRYVSQLFRWALDGGNLSAISVRAWQLYEDDELANQLLRACYLDAYPVLGRFVSDSLASIPSDTELNANAIEHYLAEEEVGALKQSVGKLKSTMRDLGFIRKVGGEYVVTGTSLPLTAFLILLHYHLAPEPATIPVDAIIEHPFWRYLGGRQEGEVRSALSLAAARDSISRYALVDGLEQITTRFSLEELLQMRVRLDS